MEEDTPRRFIIEFHKEVHNRRGIYLIDLRENKVCNNEISMQRLRFGSVGIVPMTLDEQTKDISCKVSAFPEAMRRQCHDFI